MTQERKPRRGAIPVEPHEERLGCIFKVTCQLTSKFYIDKANLVKYKNGKPYRYGATGKWRECIRLAHRSQRDSPIYEAIRANHEDDFTLEILEVVPLENLDAKMDHYIFRYNSRDPNGYNIRKSDRNHDDSAEIIEEPTISPDLIEVTHEQLQINAENKHQNSLDQLNGREIMRIRIATAKNVSAKRQSGESISYTCITVFIVTADMRYAKQALKFRFGGVTRSLDEAYEEAVEFVRQLPVTLNQVQIVDQVHPESTLNH